MSIKLQAEIYGKRIGHNARREVLLSLADHAADDGSNVRPSIAYTAWRTEYDERTVQRAVKWFRRNGVLILVRRYGRHRPNEYRIDLSPLPDKEPFRPRGGDAGDTFMGDSVTPMDRRMGDRGDASGVTAEALGVTPVTPKPSEREASENRERDGARTRPAASASWPRPSRSPLPDPFLITEEMRAWHVAHAPGVDIAHETETFRLTHRRKSSEDWVADWRLWMMRAKKFAETNTRPITGPSPAPPRQRFAATPRDPNCPVCFGTGLEEVQGKGARRCECRSSKEAQA